MDARRKGGSIPFNLMESLLVKGTRTPEQHARWGKCYYHYSFRTYFASSCLAFYPNINSEYCIISSCRYIFENADSYEDMVDAMGTHDIVNPVYYILSGSGYPQGAVLARDRSGVVHDYRMEETIRTPGGNVQHDFWVGITNYDLELVC